MIILTIFIIIASLAICHAISNCEENGTPLRPYWYVLAVPGKLIIVMVTACIVAVVASYHFITGR